MLYQPSDFVPTIDFSIKIFFREATCLFMLISGFLFQHLIHKYTFTKYIKSKLKNVIIPYVLISIPAILIYVLSFKTDHNWIDLHQLRQHSIPYQVMFFLLTGSHLGPLWFIPAVTVIYLMSPILYFLDKRNCYFIALPCLIIFFAITTRPSGDSNPILAALHFLPIYVTGMFISRYRDFFYLRFAISVTISLFIYFVLSLVSFQYDNLWGLQKVAFFIIIYLILRRYESLIIQRNPVLASAVDYIGLISFGLYFVHGYFAGIGRLIITKIDLFHGNVYATIFFVDVIILSLSIGFIIISKLIFNKKSKVLVGC